MISYCGGEVLTMSPYIYIRIHLSHKFPKPICILFLKEEEGRREGGMGGMEGVEEDSCLLFTSGMPFFPCSGPGGQRNFSRRQTPNT